MDVNISNVLFHYTAHIRSHGEDTQAVKHLASFKGSSANLVKLHENKVPIM